jgi:hypothetical protein
VAAGHQQRDERELGRIGRQERRHQVAFEVVHAQRRLAERRRQRARDARAHQQRARQAGAAREGDDVDVVLRQRRVGQRRLEQRQHAPHVVARRQLRHHAAVGLVHPDLAVQRLRTQARQRRRRSVSTSATPVSSQEDSMPRTIMRQCKCALIDSVGYNLGASSLP